MGEILRLYTKFIIKRRLKLIATWKGIGYGQGFIIIMLAQDQWLIKLILFKIIFILHYSTTINNNFLLKFNINKLNIIIDPNQ